MVARTVRVPPWTMEPANTSSPGSLPSGIDSPVTGDWSTPAWPATTTTVDRQALAGQHPHEVAGPHGGGRHGVDVIAVDDAGLGRRELREGAHGAPRALHA